MFFFIKLLAENLMDVILFTALFFCGIIILNSDFHCILFHSVFYKSINQDLLIYCHGLLSLISGNDVVTYGLALDAVLISVSEVI